MKCFIGKQKKLENNTMFYREPVKIDVCKLASRKANYSIVASSTKN